MLKTFVADKQWLAAIASEGDVFDADEPEDEQLIRALNRFPAEMVVRALGQRIKVKNPVH